MRAGKPVAVLAPARKVQAGRRRLGWARGEFAVPADFDAPLPPDVIEAFWR
jgi:antitoxin (DNA-binding transcriptional repressor) of toxin-antitoxin stability system